MKPYPECTRELPGLRQQIGVMFDSLPELESIELTHGGQRYRARRYGTLVSMDSKRGGWGWTLWTEWLTSEFYRRKANRTEERETLYERITKG